MTISSHDSFSTFRQLQVPAGTRGYFSLPALAESVRVDLARLPYCLRVLLENLLRCEDGKSVTRQDILALAAWEPQGNAHGEIAFHPARVVLQDFTGVPVIVDLAALRDAMAEMGGDPSKINPLFPLELVIDHSVQVDSYGSLDSLLVNTRKEYERNTERYTLLRWAQNAFNNLKVVPPQTGIVHQVNLEHLARVVFDSEGLLYPDTLVGTDSHTTMINGLGVLGWGVGGIEAEAAMLGQPISILIPEVVGFRLRGKLPPGSTATDLVLTITRLLRDVGVVEKFVEFFGEGLDDLPLADRATISNMSPEFGSTCAIFPIDEQTLRYLRLTGRTDEEVAVIEAYTRAQGFFRTADAVEPVFTQVLELDLGTVVPSLAGPRRPEDKVALSAAKATWESELATLISSARAEPAAVAFVNASNQTFALSHGSIVIAAITSCTNTSNPAVMMAAGLLARNARAHGLEVKPWVKTSLAPGSKVVTRYLEDAGVLQDLEALRFNVVGYGCTTCIGNSGPLDAPISEAVNAHNLVVVSVLSGNRNFEGRISPDVRANFLASPPLVVAYALVGRMDVDLLTEPLGVDRSGNNVFLRDIWPSPEEVQRAVQAHVQVSLYREEYASVFEGDAVWKALPVPRERLFAWDAGSTYVRRPSFLEGIPREPAPLDDIRGARVLAKLGDSVTTDHISPAGNISKASPAGAYLQMHGVKVADFNSYGARRGNHEVMVRGTFANVRLRNQLAPGTEGGLTRLLPDGGITSLFDAAEAYQASGTPLLVLAGKDYGTGSSRDWAAKGTRLLGVKAVLAESFERIHRSNLIGMGVLPLQFLPGQSAFTLGLSGEERFDIQGIASALSLSKLLDVAATASDGQVKHFRVVCRIDTLVELDYYSHGGILPFVLRQLLRA
ncbi:MAG: aconitate hydratase AcnA [Polyangiaceae bacterium]|nr:aconitate hydratase AcnA [Polyangiaceae bacterium]